MNRKRALRHLCHLWLEVSTVGYSLLWITRRVQQTTFTANMHPLSGWPTSYIQKLTGMRTEGSHLSEVNQTANVRGQSNREFEKDTHTHSVQTHAGRNGFRSCL